MAINSVAIGSFRVKYNGVNTQIKIAKVFLKPDNDEIVIDFM